MSRSLVIDQVVAEGRSIDPDPAATRYLSELLGLCSGRVGEVAKKAGQFDSSAMTEDFRIDKLTVVAVLW